MRFQSVRRTAGCFITTPTGDATQVSSPYHWKAGLVLSRSLMCARILFCFIPEPWPWLMRIRKLILTRRKGNAEPASSTLVRSLIYHLQCVFAPRCLGLMQMWACGRVETEVQMTCDCGCWDWIENRAAFDWEIANFGGAKRHVICKEEYFCCPLVVVVGDTWAVFGFAAMNSQLFRRH